MFRNSLYLYRYQMIRCGWQMWLFFVKTQKHTKTFFAFQTLVFVLWLAIIFFPLHPPPPPKCMFLFFKRVSRCALCCVVNSMLFEIGVLSQLFLCAILSFFF